MFRVGPPPDSPPSLAAGAFSRRFLRVTYLFRVPAQQVGHCAQLVGLVEQRGYICVVLASTGVTLEVVPLRRSGGLWTSLPKPSRAHPNKYYSAGKSAGERINWFRWFRIAGSPTRTTLYLLGLFLSFMCPQYAPRRRAAVPPPPSPPLHAHKNMRAAMTNAIPLAPRHCKQST